MQRRLETAPLIFALATLPACKGPLPCADCEAEAADDEEPPVDLPTDLPCGGADLSSDPNNCGQCGTTCVIELAGTEWEAGGCGDGECKDTRWSWCHPVTMFPKSCADYCGDQCVANGCSGHTAIFFASSPFQPYCFPDVEPFATFDGACDEPLIMESPDESLAVTVMCCC